VAPSISIAMIVKDESENLAECLDSIRSVADEICIVDTGSLDNTVAIARDHGAKVGVYLWCDDFAAPRNESLRMCTGDWVFVVDADERIAPEDLPRLRELAHGPSDVCYRFTTRNYTNSNTISDFQPCAENDENAQGFAGWYPSTKVRFFPNGRGARFEGKIHELVNASLERQGIRIVDSDVPVHHYPLQRPHERVQAKQELYLRLGHEKVAEDPTNPKAFVELGSQYAETGDFANAAAAYREAARLDSSNPITWKDLGAALYMLGRHDEARRALRVALQLNPEFPDAWRNLGVAYVEGKRWDAAVECFERVRALAPDWQDGPRYLSVALEGAGRLEEAAAMAQKALAANPSSPECLKLYIHQMLRLERRSEAREVLKGLAKTGADNPQIPNAIGELCFYDRDFDEAIAHFQQAAAQDLSAAYNNLGVVYAHLSRY